MAAETQGTQKRLTFVAIMNNWSHNSQQKRFRFFEPQFNQAKAIEAFFPHEVSDENHI